MIYYAPPPKKNKQTKKLSIVYINPNDIDHGKMSLNTLLF